MKTIIALKGRASCGKSSTLNLVIDILKKKYQNASYNLLINGRDKKLIINNLVVNKNNLRVGIETQGDPNSRLASSLLDFNNMKCDIIFCACRTRGQTQKIIESYKNNGYNIQFINQTISNNNQQQVNCNSANQLINIANL